MSAVEATPSWRDLFAALVWRARREGLHNLLAPVWLFVFGAVLETGLPLLGGSKGINNADALSAYGQQFGATTDAAQVGTVLELAPGQLALFLAMGGALVVRTLVGSEGSRGALEALLAGRYGPRELVNALLAFAATIVTALWVIMGALTGIWLLAAVEIHHAHLSLTASYLGLLFVLPLLAGWSGAALCVALSMLAPRLAQQGQGGFGGGGGLVGGIAMLPGLTLIIAQWLGSTLATSIMLVWGVLVTVLLTTGSIVAVTTRFRVEGVLES